MAPLDEKDYTHLILFEDEIRKKIEDLQEQSENILLNINNKVFLWEKELDAHKEALKKLSITIEKLQHVIESPQNGLIVRQRDSIKTAQLLADKMVEKLNQNDIEHKELALKIEKLENKLENKIEIIQKTQNKSIYIIGIGVGILVLSNPNFTDILPKILKFLVSFL